MIKSSEEAPVDTSAEVEAPGKTTYSVGLRKGMSLDLGGIGKGYIAGRMATRMHQAGATAGLVAVAGEVTAFGEPPRSFARYVQGQPSAEVTRKSGDKAWRVGVQDPRFPTDPTKLYATLRLANLSASTSGHSYRGVTIQGRRYSHIIDPKTGQPVANSIACVTVVAADPAMADACATAVAVMGVDEGMKMIGTQGAECLILEVAPKGGKAWQAGDALGEADELIAHRSSGMAALEVKATEGEE
jgi:thiamine biosynthesis lipoprotein